MTKLALFFFILTVFSSAFLHKTAALEEESSSNVKRDIRRTSISLDDFKIKRLTLQYFQENSQPIEDGCGSNEAFYLGDRTCYPLLTRGPCSVGKRIVLSRSNDTGVCAPRFCSPDRIYLPDQELCFDYLDESLCPPGREPRLDAYGDPICQCKFGTFDIPGEPIENSCEPYLARTSRCPYGQVLWSKGYGQGLECLPDPCGGANLRRGHYDLPFIPLPDGRCFQLGSDDVCPPMTWYALALDRMRGVCASLEDVGYEFFSESDYYNLIKFFGLPIARDFFPLDSFKLKGTITHEKPDSYSNSVKVTGGFYGESQNSELSMDGRPSSTYGPNEQYSSQGLLTGSNKNSVTKIEDISRNLPLYHSSAGDPNIDDFLRKVLELIEVGPHNRSQREGALTVAMIPLADCPPGTARGVGGGCKPIVSPPPPTELPRAPIGSKQ
ncbi:uncharacterized protein [Palaemon carinicauda]|uniref:uncharacterized protein n=1 Tax=Palaemon carinicauda TaxID=392227 RepID=UPI0035B5FFEC